MTCSRWLPNSTNLNQSQLSNTKPPAMYRKRRFEWSFRAAPHARLSAAPRAGLAPLQRVHVLRVQLCLPKHPMLVRSVKAGRRRTSLSAATTAPVKCACVYIEGWWAGDRL